MQETFLAVAGVAEGLVAHAALASGISPTGATVRHLEAVSNVLRGSAQRDRLYLSRLESGLLLRVALLSVSALISALSLQFKAVLLSQVLTGGAYVPQASRGRTRPLD